MVWTIFFYIYIYILGMSSSQLTNSIIFQRGSNQQPDSFCWIVKPTVFSGGILGGQHLGNIKTCPPPGVFGFSADLASGDKADSVVFSAMSLWIWPDMICNKKPIETADENLWRNLLFPTRILSSSNGRTGKSQQKVMFSKVKSPPPRRDISKLSPMC